MESCVFYKSFRDTAKSFPDEYRLAFYDYLFDCCFADLPLDSIPFPYRPAITQMLASVNSAKDRHDRAAEDGAKGGRPKKWIDQQEAEALFSELKSWKAVADKLEVDEDTLRKARSVWSRKTEKPKNLNDNVNANVNVNDNDNDNDISNIYINNNSRSRRGASEAPSLPALKEGEQWVTEPYLSGEGIYMADYETASGEVRSRPLE